MEQKKKKMDTFKLKLILVVALTVFATSAVTYGFFSSNRAQSGKNELISGCFNVEMTNESASINLANAYPISDEKGQASTPYSFTITNTCTIDAAYSLVVDTKVGSFDNTHINASVDGGEVKKLNLYTINTRYKATSDYAISNILTKGYLAPNESKTFAVRLWINGETTYEDVQGKNWEGQVRVINTVKDVEDNLPPTVADKIRNASQGAKASFADPATTDEGIYEMEDDYGMSYYYRGAVMNNYVKFAGFYWRIIRLNGDGSLRIIYDGTTPHANGESSDDRFTKVNQPFNALYDDAKYVGWMYGPANAVTGTTTPSTSKEEAQTNTVNSDIKIVVDEWYKTNIQDKGYGQYVNDTLFCNDRSIPGKDIIGWTSDTGLGYAKNATGYGAMSREGWSGTINYNNPQPTFICSQKNDTFTVNDTSKGNGSLTYPVGLITADEIVAAGSGKYNTTNNQYYLYRSSNYIIWTLSPCDVFTNGNAAAFLVNTPGILDSANVGNTSGAVAPVINLSAEYVNSMIGDGTVGNEYRVE